MKTQQILEEVAQEYQANRDYFRWLGKSYRQFSSSIFELERLKETSLYSCIHAMEYERAIDEFHIDYSTPREQYEQKRWKSYQEYLNWKKLNPEPLPIEMQRLKDIGELLEKCYLDFEAYLSMTPAYKKAFLFLLDYKGFKSLGEEVSYFSSLSEEEQNAWNDLMNRREGWKYDNDPDYRTFKNMAAIKWDYHDELETDNERSEVNIYELYR